MEERQETDGNPGIIGRTLSKTYLLQDGPVNRIACIMIKELPYRYNCSRMFPNTGFVIF